MEGRQQAKKLRLTLDSLTITGQCEWSIQLGQRRAGRKTVVLVEGSWQQAKKLEAGLPRGAWRKCDNGLTKRGTN